MKAAKMPTAAQATVLLNVLAAAPRFTWSLDAFTECYREGWTAKHARGQVTTYLTPAGRDALARWLLRDLTGPVVVLPARPSDMLASTAWLMVEILGGRDPYEARDVDSAAEMIGALRRCGWVYRSPRGLRLSPFGRDALAAWLLRGWRP